ncbi:MAG: HipA domain-containing protein [Actinobacteria bacterium]|nr:HipA domain-containing protein [Actinomycetota bacterium]
MVGLSAAHAWLQPLSDGSHVAVVERYDRLRAPDGTVTRVHQEDLGQSLGVVATRKYEREGAPGLRRVAALLGQLPVEHRAASMQGVFEALAFNYAIAGTDGHLRNFSLLLSAESATLAPLYDLNTALPYTRPHGKRFDSVRKLHSSFILGSTDAFTRVTDDDWAAVGSLFGLERDAALARVHGLAQAVGPALESAATQVAKESGLSVNVDWSSLVRDYHAACAALSDRG